MSAWSARILTLFPEMFPGPLGLSLAGKALEAGVWSLDALDIRGFATDRHQSVDDTPFGGGAGMVMRPEYATTLADGTQPDPWHDDWSCVQDFAAEGLFTVGPEQVEPGTTLTFSEAGLALTAKLRQHKAAGGQYRDFACEIAPDAAVAGGDL